MAADAAAAIVLKSMRLRARSGILPMIPSVPVHAVRMNLHVQYKQFQNFKTLHMLILYCTDVFTESEAGSATKEQVRKRQESACAKAIHPSGHKWSNPSAALPAVEGAGDA